MTEFRFQPFELVLPRAQQDGPAQAEGEFQRLGALAPALLREVGDFLFFNFGEGDPQRNFVVATPHSALTYPPRRAFEKLGRAQTLRLLTRRALNQGLWGRLFVLGAADARWIIFLGASGRHLLMAERDYRARRREWTPFEWPRQGWPGTMIEQPSSELFARLQEDWDAPDSLLKRARAWHEADYFERLWQSLRFDHVDHAAPVREILSDAVSLVAPADGARGWTFRFQLPERSDAPGEHPRAQPRSRERALDVYEQLFEVRGPRQFELPAVVHAQLRAFLEWVAPRRLRAREADFLPQREWLESNSGVGNWSLSVEVAPLSAHARLETALRLRSQLRELWGRERAAQWLAPFLSE